MSWRYRPNPHVNITLEDDPPGYRKKEYTGLTPPRDPVIHVGVFSGKWSVQVGATALSNCRIVTVRQGITLEGRERLHAASAKRVSSQPDAVGVCLLLNDTNS